MLTFLNFFYQGILKKHCTEFGPSEWSEKANHLACQLENEKKNQMNSNSHLNPQVKRSPKALA